MTHPLVKAYRRIQEKIYKGPLSVEITCGIANAYGIACPICWHDLTTNDGCYFCVSNRTDVFEWKRQELSEVFNIPTEKFKPINRKVFVP